MKTDPICRVCGTELTYENWYESAQKLNSYICKECNTKRNRLWRKANPEKVRANWTRASRKQGKLSFDENKECSMFLGVHIAEPILSQAFKNVKRMSMNNPGYDVVCNRDKKIDIKCSCLHKDGRWSFAIDYNTIADYFLCLAFDNLEDLTPLHAWLIPGSKISHLSGIGISPGTIHKWDAYALDISKIRECCDAMR